MIKISVKTDVDRAMRLLAGMKEDIKSKVVAAALNKVADKGRVEMKRQIASEFNVKAGEVNAQLSISRASAAGDKMWVTLTAFGKRRGHRSRNVMLFSAKQTRQGVTVQIRRDGGRKLIPGAFIANQGRTVFRRVGDSRLPISAVETIDVPQMFNSKKINAAVVAKIMEEFHVELDRTIKRFVPTR